jgi:PAS domain S-box-containing protein
MIFNGKECLMGVFRDITERVHQEQEIRLLNRLFTVLSKVSQAVVRATSPKAFLDEACRVIVEEGGFLLSWIGEVEAETNAVTPVAICGKAADYARGITVYADDRPEGHGPTGACIRERRPSVHNDFLGSPLSEPWRERAVPFGIRASAAFPIVSAGQVWGALTIYSDEVGFFGEEDAKLLEKVAGDIGFALDNLEKERQRRQAEAALQETRDFLENLLDYANAPIIVWDSRFKITRFNRAFERLIGRKSGDVLGRGLELLFPPEKRTESLEYIERTSIGERWENVEILIQHVDGRVRTLLWNSATLHGVDGTTVVATIAQGHDITEWRQAQDEQRKLGAQLAQAQKMEAIGTLAGGIAHDFNNILAIIMGHAEIAEFNLVKDSPAKRSIDEVLKAAYRAKDLVKQILTFSRKGEQERKPMQLIPVIEDALKLLRASLPTTIEIRPQIDLSPGDDLILGDRTQVQQILMNLSTNAAHAMRERGGALRVALSPVHFSASDDGKPLQLSPGNCLKLTVEDSGHGMDQTTIDHIFDFG